MPRRTVITQNNVVLPPLISPALLQVWYASMHYIMLFSLKCQSDIFPTTVPLRGMVPDFSERSSF